MGGGTGRELPSDPVGSLFYTNFDLIIAPSLCRNFSFFFITFSSRDGQYFCQNLSFDLFEAFCSNFLLDFRSF